MAAVTVIDPATVTDWGFTSSDVWTNSMTITASLAGFILLGIAVVFAPKIFGLIRGAIVGGGRRRG